MASFQSTTAKLTTGIFVAFIVLAFVFSFDTPQNLVGGGGLGQVGPHQISSREFNRMYNHQLQLYSSFQPKDQKFTSDQLTRFRTTALQTLIDQKLYIILAEESGIHPGPTSIRKSIREDETFKTDGHFDLIKYKNLLSSNGYTPSGYEKSMAEQLMSQKSARLSSLVPISHNFAQELLNMKETKKRISIVRIRNDQMEKFLTITPAEIDQFLAKDENKKEVEKVFQQRKSSFEKGEQVKARHILFKGKDSLERAKKLQKKITPENFAQLAKEHSEDSTKTKGGDLGWFKRNRMVPEFDKVAFSLEKGKVSPPVKTSFGHHFILVEGHKPAVMAKLAHHQRDLAMELLRTRKKDDVAQLRKSVAQKFQEQRAQKSWKKLAQKYSLPLEFGKTINQLEDRVGPVKLSEQERKKIFSHSAGKVFLHEQGEVSTVVQILAPQRKDSKKSKANKKKGQEKDDPKRTVEQEWEDQRRQISYQFNRHIMDRLWEKISIKCRGTALQQRQDVEKCVL